MQTIRNELRAQPSSEPTKLAAERVVSFAVAAVRSCLVHRNYGLAQEMLDLGAKLDDQNAELAYLRRICERENAEPGSETPRR